MLTHAHGTARAPAHCGATPRVRRRAGRLALAVVAALLVLAHALLVTVTPAHAEIVGCRSDPVVTLSNGVTFDLSATIDDAASDVQQTLYVLHAPVGTQVVSVVGTDSLVGLTEHFAFYADEAPHTYATDTIVSTGASTIAVTANTVVVGASGSSAASASGQAQQDLQVAVTQ
jgi:hypothetical protein